MRNKRLLSAAVILIIVGPEVLAQQAPATATATPTEAAVAGLRDRKAIEQWSANLTGEFQAGALYWSAHRSVPKEALCRGTGEWQDGCTSARQKLEALDARRRTDPEYKAGWNSYQPSDAGNQGGNSTGHNPPSPALESSTDTHFTAAVNYLTAAQKSIVASKADAQIAYANMHGLRTEIRKDLGCPLDFAPTSSDDDCIQSIPSSIVAVDRRVRPLWLALWRIEGIYSLAYNHLDDEFSKTLRQVDAVAASPHAFTYAAIRQVAVSAALLAETDGEAPRKMSADVIEFMGELQVEFRGEFVAITEPGRRAAQSVIRGVSLAEDAEREVDLAVSRWSIPSGHVLIHTKQ